MRSQFSLMGFLLAVTVLALVLWNYSPRTNQIVIEKTGKMLDLAIVGEGYFELTNPDGMMLLCRRGRFDVNLDGQISHEATSYLLAPGITVPSDQPVISVSPLGEVRSSNRNDSSRFDIGRISLLTFPKPNRLLPMGNGCFEIAEAAGTPMQVNPGEYESGYLMQGWLERETPRWTLEGNLPVLMLIVCVGAATIQVWLTLSKRQKPMGEKLANC